MNPISRKRRRKRTEKKFRKSDLKGDEVRSMKFGWVLWYGMIRYSTVQYCGITRNFW